MDQDSNAKPFQGDGEQNTMSSDDDQAPPILLQAPQRPSDLTTVTLDAERPLIGSPTPSTQNPLRRRISQLGTRIDSYATLVPGAGKLVLDVQQQFKHAMDERALPGVAVGNVNLRGLGLLGDQRPYQYVYHQPGITVAVYSGEAGKDLYLAWDAYVAIVWNRLVLGIIFAIPAFLTVVALLLGLSALFANSFLAGCFVFLFIAVVAIIPALTVAVLLILLVQQAGKWFKGDLWAFLRLPIDHFTKDDITAMMFAVQHSLMIAVDKAGADASTMRTKETYQAGSSDRTI